ncbi:MAG: glycoside hydrolase family 43 protein [Planctomycetota bacterium]
MIALLLVATTAWAQSEFRPGEVWLDTDGKPIQAHGGGILLRDGVYYWYGEDKTHGDRNRTGIACYSSKNLYRWKREGVVLPKEAMPPQFRDDGVVERPKVLYNAKTSKFVMWMHLDDSAYRVASAGVATSDQPTGPFVFRKQFRPIRDDFNYKPGSPDRQKELGGTFRDMNLFLDDDGSAYVFYASEGNGTLYIVRLDEDFLGPQTPTVQNKTWARILVRQSREAPAPLKYNGRYYLITSDCSGWSPNAASYAVAQTILGPWQTKGNPCVGPGTNTTFRSQSTFVLPVANKPNSFIFLADRWNSRKLEDSRYVWLPLTVKDDGTFALKWRDKWDMSVFTERSSQEK